MDGKNISVELEIKNRKGLHARAAAAFVKAVENFKADIEVEKAGLPVVSGRSIMGLMMLSASQGSVIRIIAAGADAQKVIDELSRLINNKFGED